VVFLIVAFGGIAAAGHRNHLISLLTADWQLPGGGPATHLSIYPETRGQAFQETATGRLVITGTFGGRAVSGFVDVPRLPPWGSTARATLLGARWTLRLDRSGDGLTVVTDTGRESTLSAVR
jgi:hypothetical protein